MVEEDSRSEINSDQDVIGRLREKGVPPKDIDDALNREKIKSAVSADIEGPEENMQPSIMRPERPQPLPTEGTPPSDEDLALPIIESREIDRRPKTREISEESYVPQPQEEYVPSPQYAPAQEYSQGYAPQEIYDEYATSTGITDTDTMIEISEQVFSEKIKKIQKQIESMIEFKTLAETKIEYISARLKRIETVLDNLQSAILEKVGSYGRGLENIKKEMSMMQDSFGKMVGGLAEKHHAHLTHHIKKNVTTHHLTKKTSKRK